MNKKSSPSNNDSSQKATARRRAESGGEETLAKLKDLEIEINHLRSIFRDITEAYALVVEGEMAQLTQPIHEALEESRLQLSHEQQGVLDEMIAAIQKIRIRPEKGKRKDLKKIEQLVVRLQFLAERWQ